MAKPIQIKNLKKCYGTLCAVNDVSFEIEAGEIFGLLGPNGAGKTSIISTITTVEEPTAGTITVFGHDVTLEPKITKSLLGCVPQELVNHGFFNVEEILNFYSGYYGIWNNKERINYLIERLGLKEHRKKGIKELSGGMKRRLLIAKALVHKPKLLLLDEPTAGVDIELRTKLWDFVRELRNSGTAILLTTHYLEEAEQMCDRVAFLDYGALKIVGETKSLVKKYTSKEISFCLKDTIPTFQHEYLVKKENGCLKFKFPAKISVGELLADLPINIRDMRDLKIREGKLEDAFQNIMGRK